MSNKTNSSGKEALSAISDSINQLLSSFSRFLKTSDKTKVEVNFLKEIPKNNQLSSLPISTKKSKIPVSVILQEKPNFLRLFEQLQTTAEVEAKQLKTLINELTVPQKIEIKVKEIYSEDEDDLWNISQHYQENLKSLIRKSLNKGLKNNFKIESWSFQKGCLSIIIVIQLLVMSTALVVNFLSNYEQIKNNAKVFYQDTKQLIEYLSNIYQDFINTLEETIKTISEWFNSDGWGFSRA